MAFSNIENSEKLDIIDIAVVENEDLKNNEVFSESLKKLGDESEEDRMFNIKYVTKDEGIKLLDEGEITRNIDARG